MDTMETGYSVETLMLMIIGLSFVLTVIGYALGLDKFMGKKDK